MKNKARLAVSEFDRDTNFSIRRSLGFPGSTFHGHDFYELDIITDKRTSSSLNGKRITAKRGNVFFLTPEDFHEYSFESEFDLYNIQFTVDTVSSEVLTLVSESGKRIFDLSEDRFLKILSYTELIYSLSHKRGVNRSIATRLLECILLTLSENGGVDTEKGKKKDAAATAISYVHAHFKENPSLSELAAALSISEKYFCKKFKEYTGQTYKEYLRTVKLRYARRLLLATELPIIEICAECGYSTQSHFNREFKDYFGITPMKMRQRQSLL